MFACTFAYFISIEFTLRRLDVLEVRVMLGHVSVHCLCGTFISAIGCGVDVVGNVFGFSD